jgi:ribosomal protein S25
MFDYSMAHNLLNAGLVFSTGALGVTLASTMFKFTNSVGQEWDRALKKINKNICNKDGQTFRLTKIRKIGDNYTAKCIIPSGLSFKQLEDIKPILEDSLGAVIQLDHGNFSKFVNIDIITSKPSLDFKPIECSVDNLFLGYKPNGKPFLMDVNINPHLLFCGTTGTGKTTAMFITLTNLLANKEKKFELWIGQVINRETSLFKECKNVKMVANTLEEVSIMLERICNIADRRAEKYEKANCRNINQYNKYNSKKDNRVYVVLEEFSFFKEFESDRKEVKELKLKCEECVLRIVKAGRACGIHLVSALQRCTSTNIDTTIRSQLSVLSFRLKGANDSKIAVGTEDAVTLGLRECVFDGQDCYEFLIAPKIDEDFQILKQYVPEIKLPTDLIKDKENNSINTKKERENVTVLPPSTIYFKKGRVILQDNLEVLPDIAVDKEVAPSIPRTNGKYDKQILKFIEDFKSITVKQAEIMFYKNNNNARRRLKELEEQGILKSYKYNKSALAYTFKEFKEISEHDTIRNDFVSQLVAQGSTINSFKVCPRPLNGIIIPDLYIEYTYQNSIYKSYVEVDLTHFTGDSKITLYNKLYQQEDFNLFILRDSVPKFRILPKFQTRVLPLKKFIINI